ncbi:MAG: heavy metal-binding domain-containing protein, partial [Sulfurimonas sp.]|nr:heavy metal-binding domain-containing protein [Sulfurimonas sp.]
MSKYTCPMHPEVIKSEAGNCPKCGMALEEVMEGIVTQTITQYTCPMHPEVISDTEGTCPKCGRS